jgi:putative ABC transport system permease protein
LSRATNRAKEFAVRGALGATKRRLVQQLMTESLLLFLFGGIGGIFFGFFGMHWIEAQIPGHIRGYLVNYGHVELDFATLLFTLGITVTCGIVFGLAPAFSSSRFEPNRTLKESGTQTSGSKGGARLRRIFVAAEIAVAVVVLIVTTLLVKSFVISVQSSPGFNPANLLVAQLALPKTKYSEDSQRRNFADDVLRRIRALPQAPSVGAASLVPFGGFGAVVVVEAADKPAPSPAERLGTRFAAVSANYFSVMETGLVKGRVFEETDGQGGAPVAIINETLARKFWPDEDPIGRQLRFGEQLTTCTIVGVVRDIKSHYMREHAERQMYVSLAQFPSATLGFAVRTDGDSTTMATAVRDAIWAVDRDQPISSVEPLETLMAVVDSGDRMVTVLMVFFGVLALFLGAIGIYGVMSDQVSQRTHEIGIRTALGANRGQLMGMVMRQGLKLALIGLVFGVPLALGAGRLLATVLYQVTPTDPMTFIAVPIVFALVAALACGIPARKAMRVDPLVALRHE